MGLGFRGWACTKALSLHKQAILAEEKRRGGEAFCFAWSDDSLMDFLLLSLLVLVFELACSRNVRLFLETLEGGGGGECILHGETEESWRVRNIMIPPMLDRYKALKDMKERIAEQDEDLVEFANA
jgi:hypothetical protein